jgi:hypothetical protein
MRATVVPLPDLVNKWINMAIPDHLGRETHDVGTNSTLVVINGVIGAI